MLTRRDLLRASLAAGGGLLLGGPRPARAAGGVYAIAPYIGTGTPLVDPFRPRGSDQAGWSAIDLRPDGGATLGGGGLNAAFVHLPVDDPDPQITKLADDLDEVIGPARRTALENRFGVTLRRRTLRGIVWEMMLLPHANAWKPLRAGADGQFRLRLGPIDEVLRSIAGGATHTESFTGGDQAALAGDLTWTEVVGTGWTRTTNRAQITGNVSDNHGRAEHDLIANDAEVKATIGVYTFGGGLVSIGVSARYATAASTFYMFVTSNTAGWIISKVVAGTETQLAAPAGTPANGQVLRFTVIGSDLVGWADTTLVAAVIDTAIDGTTVGGKRGGIRGYSDNAGTTGALDAWQLRDIQTAAAATVFSPFGGPF